MSLKKEKEASGWGEKKGKDRPPEPGAARPAASRFGTAVMVFVLGGVTYRCVPHSITHKHAVWRPPFRYTHACTRHRPYL